MRLIEGKKNPELQIEIQKIEKDIKKYTNEYHKLEKKIRSLLQDWKITVKAERMVNKEEWMLSDEVKYSSMEFQLYPSNMRNMVEKEDDEK